MPPRDGARLAAFAASHTAPTPPRELYKSDLAPSNDDALPLPLRPSSCVLFPVRRCAAPQPAGMMPRYPAPPPFSPWIVRVSLRWSLGHPRPSLMMLRCYLAYSGIKAAEVFEAMLRRFSSHCPVSNSEQQTGFHRCLLPFFFCSFFFFFFFHIYLTALLSHSNLWALFAAHRLHSENKNTFCFI